MKMKQITYILTLILILASIALSAQVSISRQVIGSTGSYATGTTMTLSSTVGETVVQSHFSTSTILTQGFQQSDTLLAEDSIVVVSYEVINESCRGMNNGSIFINEVTGLVGLYSVSITALNNSTVLDETNLGTGSYTVDITDTDSTYSDTVMVGLDSDEDCVLKFYSGMTPNGDGLNDLWIIDNVELYPENKIQIFNRWGAVVWSRDNYNNTDVVWGGLNDDGTEMTDATYFYVAEVGGQTYKGWVEISR
jgi:gliding motility-associated-like protein